MARGNSILLSVQPRGVFHEGPVDGTPKPGTVMQIKAGTAMDDSGRFTWTAFNRDADGNHPGGPLGILLEDRLQGKLMTQAYAAGDRCRVYVPVAGEEFNMIKGNEAGTADDVAVGSILMVNDGDGLLIHTTGSPESEPFLALEVVNDPTADQLIHCIFSGF